MHTLLPVFGIVAVLSIIIVGVAGPFSTWLQLGDGEGEERENE